MLHALVAVLQAVASGEGKVDTVLNAIVYRCVSAWENRTVFQKNLSVLLVKARSVSERWFALPELGVVRQTLFLTLPCRRTL